MEGSDLPGGIPLSRPPSKRRRVEDESVDSTPRYRSPDQEQQSPSGQNLSIRQGRPPSISRSASRSPIVNRHRSSTPSSPRGSPHTRSRSHSRSRSRSQSYSRSRSRSRSPRFRSSSRSRSRSEPSSRSRSRSRSSSSQRSLGVQEPPSRLSPSTLQPPTSRRPVPPQPLIPRFRRRLAIRGHTGAVSQVRISPDGRWIASASSDGTVKIWDAETGGYLDTLVGHMAGISCLAWAPDGNTLATGSDDKAIRLWDRVTGNPAHACGDGGGRGPTVLVNGASNRRTMTRGGGTGRGSLLGHHNYVSSLAFSPKGNILASGSYDEAVFLWDVRAGRLMRSLPAHSDPVSGIDFCRDGTLVVSCSTDGLIRVWDTSTGQCLRTLVHEDNPAVTNVCFAPNGRFVLAFSLDSSIRLWDYVSGTVKKTYQGHKNKSFAVGGSFGRITETSKNIGEDGVAGSNRTLRSQAFLASASEDGDIVLWDVRSKKVVQRIQGTHKGVCFWVDINGDSMVSAGQDGMINIFRHAVKDKKRDVNEVGTMGMVNGGHGEETISPDTSGTLTSSSSAR
ncbi:WD40-repeat-containing domain protein [Podospora didyma]|uniref:Mitochondrial division protein 1 n=1 Tax=Podospora didyma TaxID=330526 RepID=A0AAE0U890_9PEZI|nr:WD40-repeat-containing domain protein [Podospora didyma]